METERLFTYTCRVRGMKAPCRKSVDRAWERFQSFAYVLRSRSVLREMTIEAEPAGVAGRCQYNAGRRKNKRLSSAVNGACPVKQSIGPKLLCSTLA